MRRLAAALTAAAIATATVAALLAAAIAGAVSAAVGAVVILGKGRGRNGKPQGQGRHQTGQGHLCEFAVHLILTIGKVIPPERRKLRTSIAGDNHLIVLRPTMGAAA